jgi:hypothetical protein
LLPSFYPRYFGYYDRAITVYAHVSDQFSAFSTRAISCSPREAIYVLDGLLETTSGAPPRRRTSPGSRRWRMPSHPERGVPLRARDDAARLSS